MCPLLKYQLLVVKEVCEPPGVFSLQANGVFSLHQRSELILTSNCRMGKLKPAMETGKIWISSGLSFRLVFSVNGHRLLLDIALAIRSKSNKNVNFLCPSYPTPGTQS